MRLRRQQCQGDVRPRSTLTTKEVEFGGRRPTERPRTGRAPGGDRGARQRAPPVGPGRADRGAGGRGPRARRGHRGPAARRDRAARRRRRGGGRRRPAGTARAHRGRAPAGAAPAPDGRLVDGCGGSGRGRGPAARLPPALRRRRPDRRPGRRARRPSRPGGRAPVDAAAQALLDASVNGVAFPAWKEEFGWRATGQRGDDLDGRDTRTVEYQKEGKPSPTRSSRARRSTTPRTPARSRGTACRCGSSRAATGSP